MTSGAELVIAAVSALSGLAAVATLAFSYWQWVRQGFLVSTSVRVAHDNQTIRVVIYNRGRLKGVVHRCALVEYHPRRRRNYTVGARILETTDGRYTPQELAVGDSLELTIKLQATAHQTSWPSIDPRRLRVMIRYGPGRVRYLQIRRAAANVAHWEPAEAGVLVGFASRSVHPAVGRLRELHELYRDGTITWVQWQRTRARLLRTLPDGSQQPPGS
jgi:hypothetical protein